MNKPTDEWNEFATRLGTACAMAAELTPVDVGPTPRELAWSVDGVRLWRYGPARLPRGRTPILMVYSLVNRPYLLDLQADRSLIGALVERGHSVFLVDWGTPGAADRQLSLSDYIVRYLGGCAEAVRRASRRPSMDLLGVCQGGTFALCHAALEPASVRRLVTMVTPVDFATPGDALGAYAREVDVAQLVATFGNVPGEFLRLAFQALKPLGNTLGKLIALAEAAGDRARVANHLRMERWIADSPDQAGVAFAEFVQAFYRDNALVTGGLVLGGRSVDLGRLTMPILNLHASRDHLVPPASSQALATLTGSTAFRSVEFDGGHIGVYVSARGHREVPAHIDHFLRAARP